MYLNYKNISENNIVKFTSIVKILSNYYCLVQLKKKHIYKININYIKLFFVLILILHNI